MCYGIVRILSHHVHHVRSSVGVLNSPFPTERKKEKNIQSARGENKFARGYFLSHTSLRIESLGSLRYVLLVRVQAHFIHFLQQQQRNDQHTPVNRTLTIVARLLNLVQSLTLWSFARMFAHFFSPHKFSKTNQLMSKTAWHWADMQSPKLRHVWEL